MEAPKKRRAAWWLIPLAVILALGVLSLFVYAHYMQYAELGSSFTKVFWTDFSVGVCVWGTTFVLILLLLTINFQFIRKHLQTMEGSFDFLDKWWIYLIVHTVLAAVTASLVSEPIAERFLPFSNSMWFGMGDPIFHQDVGYYVFQRPLYIASINGLLSICMAMVGITLLSYVVYYAIYDFYKMKALLKERRVMMHLVFLITLCFLVKATQYRFMVEDILFQENKEFFGAGYTDIHVWLPYYRVAPWLLLGVAAGTMVCLFRKKLMGAVACVCIYPLTLVATMVVAGMVQLLVVAPNEVAMEIDNITSNINMTRAAYDLDHITEIDFQPRESLTAEDILENGGTIDNIRLTDFTQTLLSANQLQAIKNYYRFTDMDIVTYDIGGKQTAVMLGARELDTERLEESAKNYTNMRMRYTHGSGVAMSPVNRITEQGQPYMLMKDIPTRSIEGAPEVTEPRIYYGELAEDYVIAGTKDGEVDEASGGSVYRYNGSGGIPMNLWNRLVFSAYYRDFRMLFSSQITSESRLMLNRNIMERVQKAAPFLQFDQDPTIVVDGEGRLKWIVDGYTTTAYYPYAQRSIGGFNYIRNSVKAVVDAFDGSVQLYVIDGEEPIIKSYRNIYPTLFEEGELPEDLAAHTRYPEYLFQLQAEMLKKYHMTDPQAFSQKRDLWSFSKEKYDANKPSRDVVPYYNLLKIRGEKEEELVLMIPYTPVNKDNMLAWLAVRCDGDRYGELVLYRFPGNQNVYGTYQVENRIDNDPVISQDLALWSQGGSSVVRGNMLVIPVEDSLLYVEPVYITSGDEENTLPEIKRVIVAYGDKLVAEPTLNESLEKLFGVNRPVIEGSMETMNDAILRAVMLFDEVQASSAEQDWETFGINMKQLEETMAELKAKLEEQETQPQAEEETDDR